MKRLPVYKKKKLKLAQIVTSECPVYAISNFDRKKCVKCPYKGEPNTCSFTVCLYDQDEIIADYKLRPENEISLPPGQKYPTTADTIETTTWTFACARPGYTGIVVITGGSAARIGDCGRCSVCRTLHTFFQLRCAKKKGAQHTLRYSFAIPKPKGK